MNSWLELLDAEYFSGFLPAGGASVKFVVSPSGKPAQASSSLLSLARERGFLSMRIDAAKTRLNRSDQVFFEIARHIDWDALALHYVAAFLRSKDIAARPESGNIDAEEIESRYPGVDVKAALQECLDGLYRDYSLTYEFRLAMIQICRSRIAGAAHCAEAVKGWLRGEVKRISEVKDAKLFARIGRHNARLMLQSLTRWLRLNGHQGLVLAIEIGRCLQQVRPAERTDGVYYSPSALTEVYEVLRQLVDASSDLTGSLVLVYAPQAFLEDEKRGVDRYQALRMRIFEDVHVRAAQNPLAPLYRAGGESQ